MFWRDYVSSLTKATVLAEPAAVSSISALEQALGVTLPDELSSLLQESDGIEGEYGLGLIWSSTRIREDNISFRNNAEFQTLYMPFDCLLFFADAGNGDQFAYTVLAGSVRRPDIFVWNHEDDSRTWAAPDLRTYLEWWLTGRLTV